MEKLRKYVYRIIYTYHSYSINSQLMYIISTAIQIIINVTIINVQKGNKFKMGNLLTFCFNAVHSYLYIQQYFHIQKQYIINLILLILYLLIELLLFYLLHVLLSATKNHIIKYLTSALHFFHLTFSLQIFVILANILKYGLQNHSHGICFLAIFNIIISIITQFYIIQYNFTSLYRNKFIHDQLYNMYDAKIHIGKKIIIMYVVFRGQLNEKEIIVLSVFLIMGGLVKLISILLQKINILDQQTQTITCLKEIFIAVYYFMMVLSLSDEIVRSNVDYGFIAIYLFSCWAYNNYLTSSRLGLLTKNIKEIDSQSESLIYMRLLYKTYQNSNIVGNSLILTSIIRDHINLCEQPQCFCNAIKKIAPTDLRHKIYQKEVVIQFIRGYFEKLSQKYHSYKIYKNLLAFNVEVMREFSKYYYEVHRIIHTNVANMNMVEEYGLFLIEKEAQRIYHQRNSFEKNIIAHKLIEDEKLLQQFYIICSDFCRNLSNVYEINQKLKCNLNLIEQQLELVSQNLYKIYSTIKNLLLQNSISFQLLNLSLFYATELINCTEIKYHLQEKIRFLIMKSEYRELKDINFNVNLYSQFGCVIGSMVQEEKFGHLTNISSNAYKIFNYPRNDILLGMDLNKLILPCLREEHIRTMANWKNTGKFKFDRQGVFLQYFCCDFEEYLLRCVTKFQVLVIEDNLFVYVGVIKKQEQDDGKYIAVDKHHIIDCHSRSVGQIFGTDLKKINVESVLGRKQWSNIKKKLQQDHSGKFVVELKNVDQDDSKKYEAHSPSISSEVQQDLIKLGEDFPMESNKKIQHLLRSNYNSLRFLGINPQQNQNPPKHAKIKVTKMYLNNEYFYMIHIQQLFDGQEIKSHPLIENDPYEQRKGLLLKPDGRSKSQIQSSQHISAVYSGNFKANRMMKNDDKIKTFEQSNISSKKASITEKITLKKLLGKLEHKATQGHQTNYPLLKIVTLALFANFIFFISLNLAQMTYYKKGVFSYKQVVYADTNVGDNFQLLQMLYNQIHMINQHCQPINPNITIASYQKQSTNCLYIIEETNRIYNILYPIMHTNIELLIKNKTALNHPYYIYELEPVIISLNGTIIQITTYQYMEYFLQISKKIIQITEQKYLNQNLTNPKHSILNQELFQELIVLLKQNWPELVQLNHHNQELYRELAHQQLYSIKGLIILMTIISAALVVGLFYALFMFYRKDSEFLFKVLKLFRYIPTEISEEREDRYYKISEILNKAKWSKVDSFINKQSSVTMAKILTQTRATTMKQLQTQTKPHIKQLQYIYLFPWRYKLIVLVLSLIMLIISMIKTSEMIIFYRTCFNISDNVNNLMSSQNYLLQGYYTYKNYYMFKDTSNQLDSEKTTIKNKYKEMIQKLDNEVNKQQIDFLRYCLQAVHVFKDTTTTYMEQFKNLLTNSICQFQSTTTKNQESCPNCQKCQQLMLHKINQQGILATMNYFHRMLYQQIIKTQVAQTNNGSNLMAKKLDDKVFNDIDTQIIYMFKIFQQVQIKINEGLVNIINLKLESLQKINNINIFIILGIIAFFLANYRKQCIKLTEKFGYLLVYPKQVVKNSIFIEQSIVKIIQK